MLALCCALSHVLFFAIPRTGACQAPLSMEFSSQEYWSSWSEMGKQWKRWETLFSWAPKSLQLVTAATKLKDASWKKSYDKPQQLIKKQRHYFADKGPSSQSYGFSISHVWMWELDYKEGWAPKKWCFWTVVLVKDSWESLELQGNQTSQS